VTRSLESNPVLREQLMVHILRALLKMTIKVPLLFESTFQFVSGLNFEKGEAFTILSRAYQFSDSQLSQIFSLPPLFQVMIASNQELRYGQRVKVEVPLGTVKSLLDYHRYHPGQLDQKYKLN
jgi:hypothetical protein